MPSWPARAVGATFALLWMAATGAEAQTLENWTDRGFVNIGAAVQPASRTARAGDSFDLYREVASWTVDLPARRSSSVDLMAGGRIWRNVGAAIAYSRFSEPIATTLDARVPDPLRFGIAHEEFQALTGLVHRERAVHLSAVYMIPVRLPVVDAVEVLVYAGPSFFSLTKDVVTGISVAPGTSRIEDVEVTQVSTSAASGHIGLDIRYFITRNVGAGLFVRGASATMDVPQVEGGTVDVGGLSWGGGLRVRF